MSNKMYVCIDGKGFWRERIWRGKLVSGKYIPLAHVVWC